MIGERFAWAHLPKTGGDATAAMFARVPGLVRFADPLDSHDKHAAFFAREDQVRGKLLTMNIRRLDDWIVSMAHHRARSGAHPDYVPQALPSAGELAESTEADDTLRWMTDGGRFEVERWLRQEHLADDVVALLRELEALDEGVARRVRGVGRINTAPEGAEAGPVLSDREVARLYERNPAWAEIELGAYGELPIDR